VNVGFCNVYLYLELEDDVVVVVGTLTAPNEPDESRDDEADEADNNPVSCAAPTLSLLGSVGVVSAAEAVDEVCETSCVIPRPCRMKAPSFVLGLRLLPFAASAVANVPGRHARKEMVAATRLRRELARDGMLMNSEDRFCSPRETQACCLTKVLRMRKCTLFRAPGV
jgi:hypothetical protein